MTEPVTESGDVFRVLQERLAAKCRVQVEDIAPTTRLEEDLGVDSLRGVELLIDLEDHYGIIIADEEARKLSTVGEVADFVARRLAD